MWAATIIGVPGLVLAGLAAASLHRGGRLAERLHALRATIQLVERRLVLERAAAARRWWGVLGIARTASPAEIDAAYRARLKIAHPDTGGAGDAELIDRLRRARQAGLHDAGRPREG